MDIYLLVTCESETEDSEGKEFFVLRPTRVYTDIKYGQYRTQNAVPSISGIASMYLDMVADWLLSDYVCVRKEIGDER